MERVWYRQDRAVVEAALRRGERPDLATPLGAGVLDGLLALHEELGILDAVGEVAVTRKRAGVADESLLRTLAALPFLPEGSLSGATEVLFREPALLLRLGWSPVEIRSGANGRHRHPDGRRVESLPCHPDTLRDMLRRVPAEEWAALQHRGVRALYERGLVRGTVYAIDGSGIGPDLRLVSLVCVSAERPIAVAWRLLEGAASEKGREASVTRALIEQVLAAGGDGCIRLLLADALYADGPLLAWLKHAKGIDALVRLPADRRLYAEAQVAVGLDGQGWTRHRYTRTVQGHKALRTVESAAAGDLRLWASFIDAAADHGATDPTLWVGFIRDATPDTSVAGAPPPSASTAEPPLALVSTRPWPSGFAAYQAYRPRWHIENDQFRELKEGWELERQRWGREPAVALARLTLTCLAFNTAQLYRTRQGATRAGRAIRRLRRAHHAALGPAPAVIYLQGRFAAFSLEELLAILGHPPRDSLLPLPGTPTTR
ncbi:MAG TPA: transposase [Gemmatimonadales bacterium]